MAKEVNPFNQGPHQQLDPNVYLALWELAGWPMQTAERLGQRTRHRTVVIQRDANGQVIGSVEQLDETEYEQFSESWGK